jgi:hypothetical protein
MRSNRSSAAWRAAAVAAALGLAGCAGDTARAPAAPAAPAATQATQDPSELPATELLAFDSAASIRRLERAADKLDFFVLANHFEGQEHGGMCGPTSAVIVLNALRADRADRPVDAGRFPERFRARLPPGLEPLFPRYTQQAFFRDPRVAAVKSEDQFYGAPMTAGGKPDPGMQLRQLHDILRALGADSTLRVVDDAAPLDAIRDELRANLGRAGDYAVVNYDRRVLGQKGGGHISPLGAYDAASDSFLVLDVNPNDGKQWVWVPTAMMVAAMRTFDTVENRGYLLVREGATAP